MFLGDNSIDLNNQFRSHQEQPPKLNLQMENIQQQQELRNHQPWALGHFSTLGHLGCLGPKVPLLGTWGADRSPSTRDSFP